MESIPQTPRAFRSAVRVSWSRRGPARAASAVGQARWRPPAVFGSTAPWRGTAAAGFHARRRAPNRQGRRPGSAPRGAAPGPGRHAATPGEREREKEVGRGGGGGRGGGATGRESVGVGIREEQRTIGKENLEDEIEAGVFIWFSDFEREADKQGRSQRSEQEAREGAPSGIGFKQSGPSITRSNVCEDFGRRGGWLRSRSWPSFWLLNRKYSSGFQIKRMQF